MGRRRVDCRVMHVIPPFLGAFLALSLGVAGQQDKAASRPLPDIKQLLNDVRENQKQIESLVDQYSCTENEEVNEVDKNGQVKKSIAKEEYEDFYLGGQLIRREVRKDEQPLTPDEQKKEDDRVEKLVREYEKKHGEEGEDSAKNKKEETDIVMPRFRARSAGSAAILAGVGSDWRPVLLANEPETEALLDLSTFLRISDFTHPRWEEYYPNVIVFDLVPNPDYRPRSKAEDLLHKLVGTLWVDDQARQVVRLEAHLRDTLKLGGGLLASTPKGASLVIEQARMNEEVWLPSYIEMHFSVRLLLFTSALGEYTSRFSDYKKFRVEIMADSLKNKK